MKDPGKRSALLVGATGLVGSKLLSHLVNHTGYQDITTIGRNKPDLNHEGLVHHLTDFSNDWNLPERADVVFCALGTTIKRAGSQKAFRAIDYELVANVAGQAVKNGTRTFIVVSSVGAKPDTGNFYLRTKGEMEHALAKMGFARLGILRPSLLLGNRQDIRPAEQLGQYAARLLNPFLMAGLNRYRAVDAETVAAAMIGLDQSDYSGTRIIEGDEIRQLARELPD